MIFRIFRIVSCESCESCNPVYLNVLVMARPGWFTCRVKLL